MWKRCWLYVRVGLLCLMAMLVVQMFIVNVSREGEGQARTFFWTSWLGGVWSLIVAFVLGVFSTPLWRASLKTWQDLKVEKARRREEQADQAVARSLSDIRKLAEGSQSSRASEGSDSSEPVRMDATPEGRKKDREEKPNAADIWTSGDEDDK